MKMIMTVGFSSNAKLAIMWWNNLAVKVRMNMVSIAGIKSIVA